MITLELSLCVMRYIHGVLAKLMFYKVCGLDKGALIKALG